MTVAPRWCRALLVFLLAGCGGQKLVPVKGTVTLDGKPLAAASVTFLTQEDAEGRDARGFTDANGSFRLSTFAPDDGAYPGKYKVMIQVAEEASSRRPATTLDEAQRAATGSRRKPTALLPAQYSLPDQTTLEQGIPPTGPIVFDLKSKG